jgi:predicted enzyme related to lactoylglutathione lyase
MRIGLVFVAGILVGAGIHTAVAQSARPNLRLNHVGISVKALPAALQFYQEKLGFNEVVRNPNGMSAYIQVSRDTFLELQVTNAERPAGQVTHFGMETPDIKATVAQLRQRGLMPRPQRSISTLPGLGDSRCATCHADRTHWVSTVVPRAKSTPLTRSWRIT